MISKAHIVQSSLHGNSAENEVASPYLYGLMVDLGNPACGPALGHQQPAIVRCVAPQVALDLP